MILDYGRAWSRRPCFDSDVSHSSGRRLSGRFAAQAGLIIKRAAAANVGLADPAACARAFHQIQERLIVVTRGAFADRTASAIAATRQVAVLVVEPSMEGGK